MRTVPNFNPFPRELWDSMTEEEKREYMERRDRESECANRRGSGGSGSGGFFGFLAGLFVGTEFFD